MHNRGMGDAAVAVGLLATAGGRLARAAHVGGRGEHGGMTPRPLPGPGSHARLRAERFERSLSLPGWSPSTWGYDPALESFWAELRPDPAVGASESARGAVLISRDHLITTLPGLARAVARSARVADAAALRALTA